MYFFCWCNVVRICLGWVHRALGILLRGLVRIRHQRAIACRGRNLNAAQSLPCDSVEYVTFRAPQNVIGRVQPRVRLVSVKFYQPLRYLGHRAVQYVARQAPLNGIRNDQF